MPHVHRVRGNSSEQTHCLCCAADLLADKGEELGEAATFTAKELKKPQNAALALLALIGAGTTIAYPHESFQFFGFLGLQLTVILKVLSYEKPADAFAALNQSSRSFADSVGSAASSASSKLSSPAAAPSAAATDVASKEEKSAPKADAVKKSETKAPVTSMFVKTSATDKPATGMPASNTTAPSKSVASAPAAAKPAPAASKPAPAASKPAPAPAAKEQTSVKKESSGDKKTQKEKWPVSVAAAAAEAAAISQDVPKPVVDIVDKSGDASKNGNAKGSVKSEKA